VKRNIQRLCIAAVAMAGLAVVTPARGALIFVPNGTFASPEQADDTFSDSIADPTGAVPSWIASIGTNGNNAAGVWDPINVNYSGSTGNNVALPGAGGVGQTGYIYLEQFDDLDPQPLGGRLTSGTITTIANKFTYTLTVALGNANQIDNAGTLMPVEPGEIEIRLLAGGDIVASTPVPAGTLANNTFTNFTTSFTTTASDVHTGLPLTIELVHSYSGIGFREADFANVRLDATFVPEPGAATIGLLGFAVVLMGSRRAARRACD
jgi:hypothetical protein